MDSADVLRKKTEAKEKKRAKDQERRRKKKELGLIKSLGNCVSEEEKLEMRKTNRERYEKHLARMANDPEKAAKSRERKNLYMRIRAANMDSETRAKRDKRNTEWRHKKRALELLNSTKKKVSKIKKSNIQECDPLAL